MPTERAMEAAMLAVPRPRRLAECAQEARPCPWVGCRHHILLEVAIAQSDRPTAIRLNGATPAARRDGRRDGLRANAAAELVRAWIDEAAERLAMLEYTCTFDFVADHPGGASDERIAEVLGVARQLVTAQGHDADRKFKERLRSIEDAEEHRLREALGLGTGVVR